MQVLIGLAKGSITVCKNFVGASRASVKDLFVDGRAFANNVSKDQRLPSDKPASGGDSLLSKIMNNPIMKTLLSFDPLSRVLEAIIEELHITMPDVTEFANKIAQHTGQGIDTIITCLEGIIQSLVGALGKIADDPSNVLNIILTTVSNDVWNLFDAVKGMSLTICDMLVDIFDMLVEFVEGIWEIPGITDAYEDFTGQKFSLLGFATYIAAALDEEPVPREGLICSSFASHVGVGLSAFKYDYAGAMLLSAGDAGSIISEWAAGDDWSTEK
ncbi:hypothetical protein H2203_009290 [Taxawa tesnikishii (nom. ined.)]|nr:hypothetical protein H2203_009290 [Dothideales sp. JES 119]